MPRGIGRYRTSRHDIRRRGFPTEPTASGKRELAQRRESSRCRVLRRLPPRAAIADQTTHERTRARVEVLRSPCGRTGGRRDGSRRKHRSRCSRRTASPPGRAGAGTFARQSAAAPGAGSMDRRSKSFEQLRRRRDHSPRWLFDQFLRGQCGRWNCCYQSVISKRSSQIMSPGMTCFICLRATVASNSVGLSAVTRSRPAIVQALSRQ